MDRQLGEAICIARAGGMDSKEVMNLKDEYTRCIIPEIKFPELGSLKKHELKRPRDQGAATNQAKRARLEPTEETSRCTTTQLHNTLEDTHMSPQHPTGHTLPQQPPTTTSEATTPKTHENISEDYDNSTKQEEKPEIGDQVPETENKIKTPALEAETEIKDPVLETETEVRDQELEAENRTPVPVQEAENMKQRREALDAEAENRTLAHEAENREQEQEATEAENKIRKHETENSSKTRSNRKRNRTCSRETDTHTNIETLQNNTSTIRNVNQVLSARKQSKIAQKPQFKSRRKANLGQSQKNKISSYFSAATAVNIGQGIRVDESEIKLNDLLSKFSSTRNKETTRTKDI